VVEILDYIPAASSTTSRYQDLVVEELNRLLKPHKMAVVRVKEIPLEEKDANTRTTNDSANTQKSPEANHTKV
jgi:hypothetical protein